MDHKDMIWETKSQPVEVMFNVLCKEQLVSNV